MTKRNTTPLSHFLHCAFLKCLLSKWFMPLFTNSMTFVLLPRGSCTLYYVLQGKGKNPQFHRKDLEHMISWGIGCDIQKLSLDWPKGKSVWLLDLWITQNHKILGSARSKFEFHLYPCLAVRPWTNNLSQPQIPYLNCG